MVIRASAAAEIRGLVEALRGEDEVKREAAIARLAVIGPRAVEKLVAAYAETPESSARTAILRALEPIGDPRVAALAQQALAAGGDPAIAAAGVLRNLLDSPHADVAAAALDALVATVVNTAARSRTRAAALDALQDMPPRVRARVADAIKSDPALQGNTRVSQGAGAIDAMWIEASAGRLPDDPALLLKAVQTRAGSAALTSLQKMIDAARAKQSGANTPDARAKWAMLRGALHQALATRGSRVALYDLRESLLEPDALRLPAAFLVAVETIGDRTCVEPLAAALDAACRAGDAWWREHVASALRTIVRRERLTRRDTVIKRASARWPRAAAVLLPKRRR